MVRFRRSVGEKRSSRRPAGRLRVVVLTVGYLLLALSLAGVIGFFHRGGHPASIAVSAFAPYLLVLAVPAAVLFLVARHWAPGALSLAVVVMLVIVQAPVWRAAPAPVGGRAVVVMTANLKLGEADPTAVVREVRSRHVDVLMLEELTPQIEQRLEQAGLDAALPHRSAEPFGAARGTGLWSRYPLQVQPSPPLSFYKIVARAKIPGVRTSPTFVALHVGGPVPDATDWQHDLARLPAILRDLPRDAPVVVGGDFNATRSVPQFRSLLVGGYADAADQAGAGLTRTFPADAWYPPLLGIDHVLTRDAVTTSAQTVTIAGSDHRALVVRVVLDTR